MQEKQKQEIIITQKGTTRIVLSEIVRPGFFRYVLYTVDRGGYPVNHRRFRTLTEAVGASEAYVNFALKGV